VGRQLVLAVAVLMGAAPAANPLDITGTAGSPPAGWDFVSTPAGGVSAAVQTQDCHGTGACVVFTPSVSSFASGVLSRSVDAVPYRGKRIRFRAFARVAQTGGDGVTTSMTVLRPGGVPGYSERAVDRAVRGAAWQPIDIVGDVAADAEKITVRVQPSRFVASAVAGPTLAIVGDAASAVVAPPAPLGERERTNLLALARTLRIVRHFHPSDQAAAAQWETFTVDAVRAVGPARDAAALAAAIGRVFAPVAPTLRVERASDPLPAIVPPGGATGALHWTHAGFGHGSVASGAYADTREDGPLTKPEIVRVPLDGGYVADVPLSVATNGKQTLPAVTPPPPATTADASDPRDRAVHLAGVIDEWEIVKTFSPYLDTAAMPWDDVLPAMLAEAATDADARAYAATLGHEIHALRDGHGGIVPPAFPQRFAPDITVTRLGDAIVVDRAGASTGLKPGDIVVAIDRQPASAAWDAIASRASGTPQWIAYTTARQLLQSEDDVPVVIAVQRGSTTTVTAVPRAAVQGAADQHRPQTGTELRPGIIYVDLTTATAKEVDALRPRLASAHGIVFDMRGYPSSSRPDESVFPYLTHETLQSARWNVPVITHPDVVDSWITDGRWSLAPKEPYIAAKRAFVTDGRAISYAESIMGIVEAYHLGEIVGEPTAGTNGNVNSVALPGGYGFVFTGMKVLKHDGSPHHLVGILPTIPVHRTLAGIAAGRDELLDAAVAAVSR
jgi:hypothetical protein